MEKLKFYKVLDKDNKSKDGGNFDYTEFLPKENKKGKWLPLIKDLKECKKGYHITNYWNMWISSEDNKIFEVEVKELQEKSEVGVIDKFVCGKFRFIKEVKVSFDISSNTGNRNTGNRNTGDRNTGDSNTGSWNTGDSNTGSWNTGDSNTGYSNTGNRNTGDSNTGSWNTGDSNTGYSNTGNSNTGSWNTGNSNTGNRNTGNRNTGSWNNSNFNNGFFNTKEVEVIKVFNKDCHKSIWDNCKKPSFIYFDLDKDYKKSFIKSFENTNKEDVELLLKLPNFDYKVFEKISGISKKMIENKLKEKKRE